MVNAPQHLIVEDEPLIALDLQTIIEDGGYCMAGSVDTMYAALAAALSSPVDVAIMDIELATLPNGVETARRLRKEHEVQSLFVSANIDAGVRAAAAVLDAVGFIDKPFVPRQIVDTLSTLAAALSPAPRIS